MASWKEATWNMAWSAAEDYFDHGINKFPGDKNRFKGMDRDEAITKLAKEAVPKLRELVKENEFGDETVRKLDELDVGAVRKYLYEFGEEPFGATRKGDFDKEVVDKWYGWGPKETEAQMYKFGYDPNRPGDKQKFLEEIREYQTAHDRGKIVQNTMSGGDQTSIFPDKLPNSPALLQHLAFAAYPAMTKEATRQSLTGDFDDSKMNRATVADVLAGGTMAAAPSFKVLSGPLGAGLSAAGAETARQLIQPTKGSVSDVILAVTTAGTVPAGGQYLQGLLSRGASTGSRQYSRAFARGLRGADDPLMQERNALKQLLISARKQSENAEKVAGTTNDKPVGLTATIPELNEAAKWSEAEAKLNALGYVSSEKKDILGLAVENAEKKLNAAKKAQRKAQLSKPKSRKKEDIIDHDKDIELKNQIREEAQNEYDNAVREFYDFENKEVLNDKITDETGEFVEEIIGRDPSRFSGGPVVSSYEIDKNGVANALKVYDQPPVFFGINENIPQVTAKSVNAYRPMLDKYKAAFPQMYEYVSLTDGKGANKNALKAALLGGRVVGGVLGRMEPNVGSTATLMTGGSIGDKVTKFRESEWYKNLPKEKKNIIEKVLKGE